MKHSPFQSSYLTDFVIHEEQERNCRLFPSTAELPMLSRAVRFEFESMLPARVKRTDQRGSDFHKIERKAAAEFFCDIVNRSRDDKLQVFCLLDRDRVAHPAIVQYVFRDSDRGISVYFRFYMDDAFEEVRLCGRRLVFAQHALERFQQRGAKRTGDLIKDFLKTVFATPLVALPCGGGGGIGIFVPLEQSVVALPICENDGEFFVPTFLDINTTNALEIGLPAYPLHCHYGTKFTPPKVRNWNPVACMFQLKELWEKKTQPISREIEYRYQRWGDLAANAMSVVKQMGHGPGSRLVFLDNIPGPCSLDISPDQTDLSYNELEDYRRQYPDRDWEAILTKRDAMFTSP